MADETPARIAFELPQELKDAFMAKVKANDLDVSKTLRAWVREFVSTSSPSHPRPS